MSTRIVSICHMCPKVIKPRRKFCSVKHRALSEMKGRKSKRFCLLSACRELLARKRYANGRIEPWSAFQKRNHCSCDHRAKWFDETYEERQRKLIASVGLCSRCGRLPKRYTKRSPLCYSCARNDRVKLFRRRSKKREPRHRLARTKLCFHDVPVGLRCEFCERLVPLDPRE